MQALRKSSVPMPAQIDRDDETSSHRVAPRAAEHHAAVASPALALRDHLASRLDELAQIPRSDAAVLTHEPADFKLPMPTRLAVIAGFSLSLWLSIYLAVRTVTQII